IEERVTFIGSEYGEALTKRINHSKAVIMPTLWYENQPFVLMDSLQSDTPVIASNIGGIPDIIRDGENGFLFRAGDEADLARCLSQLPTQGIEELIRNAKKTAAEYTPLRYQQETISAYAKVLQKK
ncbi:MAG: glycosyltransferase, partial [Candidatus Moranbacteria bacterium]|nr:glycosyltransferase [Candidatus Moranbacteria bacterium]